MNYELLIAFLSVKEPKLGPGAGWNRPDDNWKVLFAHYNNNLPDGNHKLGMGCQSCFGKVYAYCKYSLLVMAMNAPKSESNKSNDVEKLITIANEFRANNII